MSAKHYRTKPKASFSKNLTLTADLTAEKRNFITKIFAKTPFKRYF